MNKGKAKLLVSVLISTFFAICLAFSLSLANIETEHSRDNQVKVSNPAKKNIRVAVLRDLPPLYVAKKDSKKPTGFAIELLDKLSQMIGFKVEMVVVESWEDAINSLKAGDVDLIPGIAIIEARKKEFIYSTEIVSAPVSFFIRAEKPGIKNLSDLAGKKVAVIAKSAAEEALISHPSIITIRMPNIETLLVSLLSGEVAAVLCPKYSMLKKASDIGVANKIEVAGAPFFYLKRAYQFRKEDHLLRDQINEALKKYLQTEDYLHLYRKWYEPDEFWIPLRKAILVTMIIGIIAILTALIFFIRFLRTKKELAHQSIHFQALFETMSPGVVYQAADGRIISANPAAEKILGSTLEQLRGKTSMDPRWKMIREDGSEVPGEEHPAMIALRTGQKFGPVIRGVFHPEKNTHIWLSITAIPLIDPDKKTPFQTYAIIDDITNHKQAEEKLRESEEKYRSLFNQSTEAIFLHDLEGRIIDVNDTATLQSGYSKNELFKMSVFDLHPDKIKMNDILSDWKQWKADKRNILEAEHQRKDGTIYPASISTGIVHYENHEVILAIVQDITERKKAEAALRLERNNIQAVFDASPVAMLALDESTAIIRANMAAIDLCGGDESEVIHHRPGDALHCTHSYKAGCGYGPDCPLCPVRRGVEDLITGAGGQIDRAEVQLSIMRENKEQSVWLEVSAVDMLFDEKRAICVSLVDTTERKRAEEKLRESEEKYRSILENMQEGYFEVDLAGNFIFVNDAECRNLGYSREELIGMNNRQYQDETTAQNIYQLFNKLYKTGEPVKALDIGIIKKNGAKGFNEISVSLVRDAQGKPIGFRGISRDITERKHMEELLRENERFIKTVMDNLPVGVAVNSVDPTVAFTYMNDNFFKIYRSTREGLADPDAFWKVTYHDPVFREQIKKKVLDDCATGNPERMHWEGIPLTREGQKTTYINARNTPVPGSPLMISTVIDVTNIKQAEEEIRKLNEELEQRVARRTAELTVKTAELERINKVFVDRELKMRELKERIAELEKKT